jgi:hypothetical protein
MKCSVTSFPISCGEELAGQLLKYFDCALAVEQHIPKIMVHTKDMHFDNFI